MARCLDTAKQLADEIIIVDTGSVDKSIQIAGQYTDKIYSFAWQDDFALARNHSFSKASGDYLIWLDADDVIPEKSLAQISALRKVLETEQPDVVMCPYEVGFDDSGNPSLSFFRERIFKRDGNFIWQGRVHECIAPRGKILRSDFTISHLGSEKPRGRRNLHIYQRWAAEEPLSPRDKFYYGRELYYHGLYTEAIAVLKEMLSGEGWYVNQIEACRTLGLIYSARGEQNQALQAYFQSFCYGEPRAVVCCEIGNLFKKSNRLKEAAFWYETALVCRDHSAEGDFEEASCRGMIPLLELVCCYYALGEREKAENYHKKTEELAAWHPSVIYNHQFFNSIRRAEEPLDSCAQPPRNNPEAHPTAQRE